MKTLSLQRLHAEKREWHVPAINMIIQHEWEI